MRPGGPSEAARRRGDRDGGCASLISNFDGADNFNDDLIRSPHAFEVGFGLRTSGGRRIGGAAIFDVVGD